MVLFDTSDSSDADEHTVPSTPSTPGTPGTPLSPLASEVSSFGFIDVEESDSSTFAIPTRKKVYKRKRKFHFTKGHTYCKKHPVSPATPSKRVHISHTRTGLLRNTEFPREPTAFDVLLKQNEASTTRKMYVPHGMEIINMDILCQVLSLLQCRESGCWGTMQLHKLPRRDGLQSHFILHCNRCHTLVAKFSSSVHIGESAIDSVNSPSDKIGPAEVNTRALVAVDSTSMSWRDYLLFCALMNLPVPGRNVTKRTLDNLVACTAQVAQ